MGDLSPKKNQLKCDNTTFDIGLWPLPHSWALTLTQLHMSLTFLKDKENVKLQQLQSIKELSKSISRGNEAGRHIDLKNPSN